MTESDAKKLLTSCFLCIWVQKCKTAMKLLKQKSGLALSTAFKAQAKECNKFNPVR